MAGDTAAAAPPVSKPGIERDTTGGRGHGLPGPRCTPSVFTGLSPTPPAEGKTSTKSSSICAFNGSFARSRLGLARKSPTHAPMIDIPGYHSMSNYRVAFTRLLYLLPSYAKTLFAYMYNLCHIPYIVSHIRESVELYQGFQLLPTASNASKIVRVYIFVSSGFLEFQVRWISEMGQRFNTVLK